MNRLREQPRGITKTSPQNYSQRRDLQYKRTNATAVWSRWAHGQGKYSCLINLAIVFLSPDISPSFLCPHPQAHYLYVSVLTPSCFQRNSQGRHTRERSWVTYQRKDFSAAIWQRRLIVWTLELQSWRIYFEKRRPQFPKIAVICYVTPYGVLEICQRFGGIHCFHIQRRGVCKNITFCMCCVVACYRRNCASGCAEVAGWL
jgi:hypothetical protein